MIQRCTNPNMESYSRYGGRGITVCQSWLEGFENFLADMGERPSMLHSLDRIDPGGNYEPENCRWADRETQAANKADSFRITHEGGTYCLASFGRKMGINKGTLQYRAKARKLGREFDGADLL